MAVNRELSAEHVIRGLLNASEHLAMNAPLDDRMTRFCEDVTELIGCDRTCIMLWDGIAYRAGYSFGYPADVAERFARYVVPPTDEIVVEINSTRRHVVIDDARQNPFTARVAEVARIDSIVVAPMLRRGGAPLGFMTAEFVERITSLDESRAQLVMGAARLAQATVLSDRSDKARDELLDEVVGAEEIERRRIAREIHDDPLQRIFAMCLHLEQVRDSTSDVVTAARLTGLLEECRRVSGTLRDVTNQTHPIALEQVGLLKALDDQLSRRSAANGWIFKIADERTRNTPPDVATMLFRVAEQALQNIQQHATASEVTLSLSTRDRGTLMGVGDDGVGFDDSGPSTSHLGLVSMRERTEHYRGTFCVQTTPGEGTQIEVWAPH